MSQPSRPSTLPTSSLRSSLQPPATTALQTRITLKRAELENLQQLRDLSANLTSQLEGLEHKLRSLKNGAQAVALVLANWENVLGVIRMAGMRVPVPASKGGEGNCDGEEGGGKGNEEGRRGGEGELPVALVRIPVQEARGVKDGDGEGG